MRGILTAKFFSLGMNANIHYWFTPEGGSEKQDIRAKETRLLRSDGKRLRRDLIFMVVGGKMRIQLLSISITNSQIQYHLLIERQGNRSV